MNEIPAAHEVALKSKMNGQPNRRPCRRFKQQKEEAGGAFTPADYQRAKDGGLNDEIPF